MKKDISKNVFIVHGRNLKLKQELFTFLRSIGLNPLEWEEIVSLTNETTPSIYKIIETGFNNSQAIIVLLTGDDLADLNPRYKSEEDAIKLEPQPRQNVIFEAGLAFGMKPKQTILLKSGFLREMSDVSGLHYLTLSDNTQDKLRLKNRLKMAGCKVSEYGEDWLNAGSFSGSIISTEPLLVYQNRNFRYSASSKNEPDYAKKYLENESLLTIVLFDGRVWFKRRIKHLEKRFENKCPTRVILVDPTSNSSKFRCSIMNKNPQRKEEDTEDSIDLLTTLSDKYQTPLQIYLIDSYLPYTLIYNDDSNSIIPYKINNEFGNLPLIEFDSNNKIYNHFVNDLEGKIKNLSPSHVSNWI